jgi:hypothetical protein
MELMLRLPGHWGNMETEAWVDQDTGDHWWLMECSPAVSKWLREQDKSCCIPLSHGRLVSPQFWIAEEFLTVMALKWM